MPVSRVKVSDVPMRRGRRTPLEPLARCIQELPSGEALRVTTLDLEDARRIQKTLGRLLRYRRVRHRSRTFGDELYFWRVS